jgi:O-antigen ligase
VSRKKISFGLLALALIALPFSMVVCHIALILFLVFWATEGKWNEKLLMLRSNMVIQLVIAFSVLQFVGLLYTENTLNGWIAIERKIFFFAVPVALATTFIRFDREEVYDLIYLFTASCFVGSLICIGSSLYEFFLLQDGGISAQQINYLGSVSAQNQKAVDSLPWLIFSYVELADGIHIHPTYFSFYLAFCVIFLFYRSLKPDSTKVERRLIGILILFFTIFIVSLSSRIVILTLFIIYVAMLAESVVNSRSRTTTAALIIFILILGSTLYINPIARYRNLHEVASSNYSIHANTTYTTSTEMRASLWWLGIQSLSNVNPLIGTGTGDVDDMMRTIGEQYEIKNVLNTYNPHNEFLYILLGNGVVTLAIFILLLAIPFRKAWVNRDYLLVGFLFLFFAICLTETILERQKGIVFFSLIFPLLAFQQKSNQLKPIIQ